MSIADVRTEKLALAASPREGGLSLGRPRSSVPPRLTRAFARKESLGWVELDSSNVAEALARDATAERRKDSSAAVAADAWLRVETAA